MTADFSDLDKLAEDMFPAAYRGSGDGAFALQMPTHTIEVFRVPGDATSVAYVRTKILDMNSVPRANEFAKAAIAGNFFWAGTAGAMLSVDEDGALCLTLRRNVELIAVPQVFAGIVQDFAEMVETWRKRSELYV